MPTNLKLHIKKCPHCKEFITSANIARHIHILHPNKVQKISHDKKSYVKKCQLKKNAKKFRCPDPCTKSFNRKENFDRHQKSKTCSSNRTYICIFCQKSFCARDTLWTHLNNRKCKEQFSCLLCPLNFRTEKELNSHGCGV